VITENALSGDSNWLSAKCRGDGLEAAAAAFREQTAARRKQAFGLASSLPPELQLKLQAIEKEIRNEFGDEPARAEIHKCFKLLMCLREDTTEELSKSLV
jgi:hypothetical protein